MTINEQNLSPAEAAKNLGVSIKTLRLYEQHGLLAPLRTDAGWRCYRPQDIAIARQIVALRALGLSIGQVGRVLAGERTDLDQALAVHEEDIAQKILDLQATAAAVRQLRTTLNAGTDSGVVSLADLVMPPTPVVARLTLPWPWGGETFDVEQPRALNFIIGPLASGKTRLAKRLADVLPGAGFLGLERLAEPAADIRARLAQTPDLEARVDTALTWLAEEGADVDDALLALVASLEGATPAILVIDLIEQDLTRAAQEALARYLRRPGRRTQPLFVMTRSTAILDLDHVAPDESIILCPPNHSPPRYVTPNKGAPGYEMVAMCLATPEVRQRTAGVIAIQREDMR